MSRNYDALAAWLLAIAAKPFSWKDRHDCGHFAAEVVRQQSGVCVLQDLQWTSLKEAKRIVAETPFADLVSARLPEIAPAFAHRGDIAGVEDADFGVRLMMVEGEYLCAPGPSGLCRVPRKEMIRAWSADV